MTQHEIMNQLTDLIEETSTGIFSTVDPDGRPHSRWMTPAVLRDRQSAVFAVTCPKFSKTLHISSNPHVLWMFQSPKYEKIIQVSGIVNILDNPSVKNEILQVLAPRLELFWKINCSSSEIIVLETVVEEATLFEPPKNSHETVSFA